MLTPGSTNAEIIAYYGGKLLDLTSVSSYHRWCLGYYTSMPSGYGTSPFINITLQLDITELYAAYQQVKVPGASFALYFMWKAHRAIQQFPMLNLRFIDNQWYQFAELPLINTRMSGDDRRYIKVLLENVSTYDWPAFVKYYNEDLEVAKNSTLWLADLQFAIASFFSNLSSLRFTSYSTSTYSSEIGKQSFVFGQRYMSQDRMLMPFFLNLNHANADGQTMNEFVQALLKVE